MGVPSFAKATLIIVSPGRVKDHGSWINTWGDNDVTKRTVTGCLWQPGATSEDLTDREALRGQYYALLPDEDENGPITVQYTDRIIAPSGLTYSVNGDPAYEAPIGPGKGTIQLLAERFKG
jgi:hypothetical protein